MKKLICIVFSLVCLTAYGQKINKKNLIVDLNPDKGVVTQDGNLVERWDNQVKSFQAKTFSRRDEGRDKPGTGRPLLVERVADLNGHNALKFHKQELLNMDEDAFDHLIWGGGYTWFCILKPGKQSGELKDVNCFFGNLRNQPNNEGLWGGFADDNHVWMSSRNAVTFGRWDHNNPYVCSPQTLDQDRFYLVMGRMGAGTDTVMLSLYLNDAANPVASSPFPVNPKANASRMAIGQERDAIQHPGRESFVGEMGRFLLYDRALNEQELAETAKALIRAYGLKKEI